MTDLSEKIYSQESDIWDKSDLESISQIYTLWRARSLPEPMVSMEINIDLLRLFSVFSREEDVLASPWQEKPDALTHSRKVMTQRDDDVMQGVMRTHHTLHAAPSVHVTTRRILRRSGA